MLAILLCLSAPPAVAYEPAGPDGTAGRFVVKNVPAAVAENLKVSVDAGDGLLGTRGTTDGVAWFAPRFPLAFGVRYTATYRRTNAEPLKIEVTLPRPATKPTTVAAVYPTGPTLPANVLKFYLHFSAPMARGEAYKRVKLLAAAGDVIEQPFLEVDEELWDTTGTRLTLLIEPGRIKRELQPRELFGPVFEPNRKYTLTIDAGWPDENGKPLAAGFKRPYSTGPELSERIDPAKWTIAPPTGTAPLVVRSPRPLDHALFGRCLSVVDAGGNKVAGKAEVVDAETGWKFTPAKAWAAGEYRLKVAEELEDQAGNRPGRLFDTPTGTPAEEPPAERTFRVK